MIRQFGSETVLLLIDVQQGVDTLEYWGGATGRRNNPGAEANMAAMLAAWRGHGLPVAFTAHDSREAGSPLKLDQPGGAFKSGLEPADGETVVIKDVNSGFIGTNLEIKLRRAGISRLVIGGFFTNMCVETTTRMAGNMGFDTYMVDDACACSNRLGPNGQDHDPEVVHAMTIANMNGEFATVIETADALELTAGDAARLDRNQGNE